MSSERELIGDNWYYFLKASGKWHVYVWHNSLHALKKLCENMPDLYSAKKFAKEFDEKHGEEFKKKGYIYEILENRTSQRENGTRGTDLC